MFDDTGALQDDWGSSESYTVNEDGTVTRSWYDDHDDDDETPEVRRDVAKVYYWGEDRQSVFMVHWSDDDDPSTNVDRYTRQSDPLPDLVGRWTFTHMYGDAAGRELVVTIGDGSFELTEEQQGGGLYRRTATLGELDPDTLFLPLTDAQGSNLDNGGDVVDGLRPFRGGTARVAIAPSVDDSRLLLSPPWDEDTPRHPSGNYWAHLTRSQ